MRIQYNGESKILKRLAELVNQKADKSDIPAVGDGTLSVQRNGKSVGTFSANAAKDTAINIPVPEKVSELENDAGYTKNTGTYIKPSTGIPKSDLASGVQASLDKADTALQKHQDISGKVDKTGDASNTTVAFSAASARENVKTGEKLSVIAGKIAKWFADLKTVAFTGNYNDLANKPTIPDISSKQDKSTAVTHTANTAVGSATKPVYIAANGAAKAITHSINADVPANAKFTDTVYTHPTTSGNKHIPSGGSSGQILRWSADGTAVWGANLPTTNVGSGSQPQEFRLAATISIKTWSHYLGVYAIGSRHSGTGILVVEVGCENSSVSFANVAAQCICFGASLYNRIQSNTFQIYVSDDGSKAYLFIKNWDYSVCTIKSLRTDGITISNGLAMASIDTSTYGTLKCQTTICGETFSGTAAKANTLVETAWTAVPATGAAATVGRSIKYLKSGNTVFVQGAISFNASLNTPVCGTMPSDCLPNRKLVFTGWDIIGAPEAFAIILDTDGKLSFLSPGTTAYWFKDHRAYSFNFSYHIN